MGATLRGTCVTGVTFYMTRSTNVTKFVPCVLLHHPVLRIRAGIVLHVTGGFSVRSVSEFYNTQIERQFSWSVRQVRRNCSCLVTGDSKREYLKNFCTLYNKKQHSGHF